MHITTYTDYSLRVLMMLAVQDSFRLNLSYRADFTHSGLALPQPRRSRRSRRHPIRD